MAVNIDLRRLDAAGTNRQTLCRWGREDLACSRRGLYTLTDPNSLLIPTQRHVIHDWARRCRPNLGLDPARAACLRLGLDNRFNHLADLKSQGGIWGASNRKSSFRCLRTVTTGKPQFALYCVDLEERRGGGVGTCGQVGTGPAIGSG